MNRTADQMTKLTLRLFFSLVVGLAVAAFAPTDPKLPTGASGTAEELSHPGGVSDIATLAGQWPMRLNDVGSSQCGPPSYKCSYDGTDAKPLCNNCDFP